MAPKKSTNKIKNIRSSQTLGNSIATSAISCSNVGIQLSKASLCSDCVIISSDIRPTRSTPDIRIFREVLDFDTETADGDDWIVDITLKKCPNDAYYQQQQELIDLLTTRNEKLKNQMKRFQIYNILCEALRFCGDKIILPHVKQANEKIGENKTFLEKFENWTQVTQYLRRSSKVRDEDQRWLQREINKVVESHHFYMHSDQWHELFHLKLPRDQAVHAALTSGDLQNLYANAHFFEEKNIKLVQTLVKRMHRSIPKEDFATVPITSGPISNPDWPRP